MAKTAVHFNAVIMLKSIHFQFAAVGVCLGCVVFLVLWFSY